MNLSAIKKQIDVLSKRFEDISSSHYQCTRDEDGNLQINFDNGDFLQVPLIPLRKYQIEDQRALFLEGKKLFAVQYPRRSGKEVESWNFIVSGAIEKPGLYIMCYPTNVRARKILWQGQIVMPDQSAFKFLDMIPKRFISKIDNTEMTVTLNNGSVIWVLGADIDPDKMRGINPRGAVLSEFAFCSPKILYILLPVFKQNGGWVFCQSTFNGINHFHKMVMDDNKDPDYYRRSESILTLIDENGNRYITDEMIETDRKAGMPEYLIQQEYYGNVQINQETRYFAREVNNLMVNNRIIEDLILYDTPCYVAMDLGMNDFTCVLIFQIDYDGNPVIIEYFENNNKELDYYIIEARNRVTKYGLHIRTYYGPHDSDSMKFPHIKTSVDYARDMGETMVVTQKPHSKLSAIQQMRRMLYRCKFNKQNTGRLIDCLSSYEKEYNEKLQVYKDHPLHNWASHGVDAFQTMTLAIDDGMVGSLTRNVIYNMA